MTETKATYRTRAERDAAVAVEEVQGRTMIHDNFLPDGMGELIFDVVPPPAPHPLEPLHSDPRWRAQWLLADTAAKKVALLAQILGLEP
mgnify:CR=1 FL=1